MALKEAIVDGSHFVYTACWGGGYCEPILQMRELRFQGVQTLSRSYRKSGAQLGLRPTSLGFSLDPKAVLKARTSLTFACYIIKGQCLTRARGLPRAGLSPLGVRAQGLPGLSVTSRGYQPCELSTYMFPLILNSRPQCECLPETQPLPWESG